ncbi:MAG: response regulator [Pseudomonadales bacterium]|nr:response regulator [Pseudomonadales bacterium]
MNQSFARLPIAKKLLLINLLVLMGALLLASSVFVVIERTAVRERITSELQSQTEIIAYNVAAAVAFNDAASATETLNSLGAIPQIQEAIIFDKDGSVFAEYQLPEFNSATSLFSQVRTGRFHWAQEEKAKVIFSDDGIHVFDEVLLDGEILGTLYLRSSLAHFNSYQERAAAIVAAVLIVTFIMVLIVMSRLLHWVSDPIRLLKDAAQSITKDGNYSVRVKKYADDELGHLTDAFNNMIEEIGRRDQALQRHYLELEAQVEERTSELQSANVSLEETVKALRQANKAIRISEENKKIAEASAEAKSQFLANISHELRTPMNGVLGMLSLLKDTHLEDDQKHYVAVANESGNLLLELLNNVLDLSKIEQGKLELETIEFDFVDAIEEVYAILGESALSKKVEMVLQLQDLSETRVVGDSIRFKQLLFNIVGNAIKFTQQGHIVTSYQVLDETSGTVRLRFEVEDTGLGIKDEAKEIIFGTFSQADSSTTRQYGGTGLGLALCKQLIKIMGGSIGVESEYGRGSTFWFEVPFARTAQVYAGDTLTKSVTSEPQDVVLVDANPLSARNVIEYFAREGCTVHWASDYPELYRLLEKKINRGERYQGLVVNLNMGITSVKEVIESEDVRCCIKPEHIAITGSLGGKSSLRQDDFLSCFHYLVKPLRRNRVAEICEYFCSNKMMEAVEPIDEVVAASFSEKILVVEDNRINQEVAVGRLTEMGYRVDIAENGQQALEKLANESFDLIFMDCQMPVLDGYQTTQKIRQQEAFSKQRIPIIAMTAHVMAGDREACIKSGMDDYIAKPFKTEQLQRVVERWLATNQSGGGVHG